MPFEEFINPKHVEFISYFSNTLNLSVRLYKTLKEPTKADIEIDVENHLLKLVCHPEGKFHITRHRMISVTGLPLQRGRYIRDKTNKDIYKWEGNK